MDIVALFIGFVLGFVAGSVLLLGYMRWKLGRQLQSMQDEMQGMFDMTEDLMEEDIEEASFEEVEEE